MILKIFGQEIAINRVMIFVFAFIILLGFICVNVFFGESKIDTYDVVKTETKPNATNMPKVIKENFIKVYLCGEVLNPGVYSLVQGTIVSDAVKSAGGFTKNAWKGFNLAWQINENVMIKIPSKKNPVKNEIITVGIDSSELTKENKGKEIIIDQGKNNKKKVNINTANTNQLMELPGVGESTAKKIIEYRKATRFNSIEEIMNVSGIGEKKYEDLKDFIEAK